LLVEGNHSQNLWMIAIDSYQLKKISSGL